MTIENAESYCNGLTSYNYSDWYLPTRQQLQQMYTYRYSIGGFYSANYWSSSWYSSNATFYYYYVDFSTGQEGVITNNKATYRVRPIRVDK